MSELFSLLILAPVSSSNIDNILMGSGHSHTHTCTHTKQALHSVASKLSFIFHIRGQQQTTKLCFKAQKENFPFTFLKKKKTKPNRLVAFILVLSLSLARTHTAHTQYTHTDTDKGRHTVRHSQHTHTQRQHTPWYKILNSGSFKIFANISQIISIFQ